MLVNSVEESRQFAGAAQADRASFDVEQQGRAVQGPGRWQVLQPAIGDQQHALLLRRQAPLALFQPLGRFVQGLGQGRAAAGTQAVEPVPQVPGGLQALDLPARRTAAGSEQGQACTLSVGVVEQLRQQALGIAQGAVPAGRGRRVSWVMAIPLLEDAALYSASVPGRLIRAPVGSKIHKINDTLAHICLNRHSC